MYRVFLGSRDDAIALLQAEYVHEVWVNRMLGVVGLWIALGLLTDPIIKILDGIKIVGSAVTAIMQTVNIVVALTVGGTTIIISMVFHNLYLLIGVIAFILIGVLVYLRAHYGETESDKQITVGSKELAKTNQHTDTTSSS